MKNFSYPHFILQQLGDKDLVKEIFSNIDLVKALEALSYHHFVIQGLRKSGKKKFVEINLLL